MIDDERMPLKTRLAMVWERFRMKVRFFIGKRLPARNAAVELMNGHKIYKCPRCGDFVYYELQCTKCGQHFLPGAESIGEVIERVYDSI